MSDIKLGDLVMVVKPKACCGRSDGVGKLFVAGSAPFRTKSRCILCGAIWNSVVVSRSESKDLRVTDLDRLKKIDPPAEGDSLPTRRDLKVTA